MDPRPAHLIEHQLKRIVKALEDSAQSADRSTVTVPEVVSRAPSLTTLRVVAIVGAMLAVVVVVLAFSRSLAIGALSLAAAPIIPLTLVVLADRILHD